MRSCDRRWLVGVVVGCALALGVGEGENAWLAASEVREGTPGVAAQTGAGGNVPRESTGAPGKGGWKPEQDQLQYSLLIAVDDDETEGAFENDQESVVGYGVIGGHVVVYVNDSPLRIHTRGSSVIPIFEFLTPGKNQIRVEGKHAERMFIKVITLFPKVFSETFKRDETFKHEQVLAKARLDPEQESVTLEFEVPLEQGPDYEELPSDPVGREKVEEDLRQWLREWIDCCRRHDGEQFFRQLLPDLKSPPWYRKDRETCKREQRSLFNVVNWPRYYITTTVDEVKMIVGKRSVILYREIGDVPAQVNLFHFEGAMVSKTSPFEMGAILLVRLEGKWMGW